LFGLLFFLEGTDLKSMATHANNTECPYPNRMKRSIIILIIVFGLASNVEAKPNGKHNLPFTHKFQVSSMYWHLGDPDWKEVSGLANGCLQYQIGYRQYFIKARAFALAGPPLRSGSGAGIGHMVQDPSSPSGIKDGAVIARMAYRTFDFVGSVALMKTHRHNLLVGLGATHREGSDLTYRYNPNSNVPDIMEGELININELGAIAEASYNVSFFKYLVASVDIGYRIYPKSTSMVTAGIGLGIQVSHIMPSCLKRLIRKQK
jgi:hypothetical protein